ncbi:MAG: DUF4346 domain-containing protein [Candidatus Aenigmarchaeota archaeon]|nr:DUF4346 domain-containing protein [Candidatus Aenigmarchaeota archaeon]
MWEKSFMNFVYFNDLIIKGRPTSENAIITLWTPKEKVAASVDKNSYAAIGQLYSKDQGINVLIRNCLANKNIRNIVITGADVTNSGETLVKFFENGIDGNYKIIGTDVFIDREIPKESLETMRKNVLVSDQRNVKDFSKLMLEFPERGSYGENEIFPKAEIAKPERMPDENSGFLFKGKYIGELWLDALHAVMRFGVVKKSQHHENQKEIINLVAVITEENPEKPRLMHFCGFGEKEMNEYLPQVLTGMPFDGVEYSYGQRLWNYEGKNHVQKLIDNLKASAHTRRAVAVTWDANKDPDSKNPPCLILIQAMVQDERLFLTAYIRSNDIFKAWVMNAYALRALQYKIADAVGTQPGSLTMISNSAHIYESDWNRVLKTLEENRARLMPVPDPRGNIIISVEEGWIKLTHLYPDGRRIGEIRGKTALELCKKIALDCTISQVSHALDIGCELQKAETALNLGLKYEQDKELKFR